MKSIIRNILLHIIALYLVVAYIPGVLFEAGWEMLIGAGVLLALLFIFIRPLLKIILLPINILTLGLASSLINVLIFYMLDRFIEPLSIKAWTFPGFEYQGLIIPKLNMSIFWTYVLVSAIISFVVNVANWLCE